nr:aminotransferase class V-fold PLP-dependent enzyme [Thermococcus sp. MV5]
MDFGGGPPYLLAVTLGASLELINRLQIEKIENHNKKLIARIRDEILSAGLEVIGDYDDHECSSIITVKTGLSYEKEKRSIKDS